VSRREIDHRPPEQAASAVALRAVMTCVPTGVTVVGTRDPEGGKPLGLTVSSFTSVALDPPLLLVCIARSSSSHDRLIASGKFAISVLSAQQEDVARRFARPPSEGRFDEFPWWPAPSGNPVLEGATAWVDCEVGETMRAGDHTIIVARALACGTSDAPALVHHRGKMSAVSHEQ
jgi:flavin reductase (DIM6/NTAB) family NADH-FMN oxidoreductase RutF